MRAFLQSLDEKVWQAVEISWTKPKEALADWDDAKIKVANFNSRALNALFSVVTNEEFKKISSPETTKEAWTILQTTYEGTKPVKDSKLQRLTKSFKEIKMEEDESFDEFYAKLKDIMNSHYKKKVLQPRFAAIGQKNVAIGRFGLQPRFFRPLFQMCPKPRDYRLEGVYGHTF